MVVVLPMRPSSSSMDCRIDSMFHRPTNSRWRSIIPRSSLRRVVRPSVDSASRLTMEPFRCLRTHPSPTWSMMG